MLRDLLVLIAVIYALPVLAESARPEVSIEEIRALNASLVAEEARGGTCLSTQPLARKIYQADPENLHALKVIADCTAGQQDGQMYALQAKEIFENSHVLSIVPKVLEMAQVKELIPVMREVEVKKNKEIADYLMLSEIYDRLGEPEKQLRTLEEAISMNSDDPRPILLLASKKLDAGHRDEAQKLFLNYLSAAKPHPGRAYLMAYVAALAYPLTFSFALAGLIWLISYYLFRRRLIDFGGSADFLAVFPLVVAIVPTLLAFRFWQTGSALPFGALLVFLLAMLFFLVKPYLAMAYRPAFAFFRRVVLAPVTGIGFAKVLNQFSSTTRILIAFTTLVVLVTVAPTIHIPDVKYAVIVFCGLAFYSTLGSLMVTFLRSRRSLLSSLRWTAVVATVPFLISYCFSNWSSLGEPLLYGRLPPERALQSLTNYLVFWGVSVFLSLHLGKIIADAISEPIMEIIGKVALIEKGDFRAKVRIFSRDEIGHLGEAVNRMGEGLERRERVEKTFSKYVDRKVAERILNGDENEVRIGGQSVDAVIQFVDIRGFTRLSESVPPRDVVAVLNRFFETMVKIVQSHGGVIDKFIGDNLMSVWGVPYPVDNAEERAVSAALAMQSAMSEFNADLRRRDLPEVQIGIGINSGKVIAGSIGSSERMEYTVIGDVVNTAQRAESMAKPGQILVTDACHQRLAGRFLAQKLEPVKVKGKDLPQTFWQVTAETSSVAV